MMKKTCVLQILVFSCLLEVVSCQNTEQKKTEKNFSIPQLHSVPTEIKYLLLLNNNECISCCLTGMDFIKQGLENDLINKQNTLIILPEIRKAEARKFAEEEPFFTETFTVYMSDSLFYSKTSGRSVFFHREKDSLYLFKKLEASNLWNLH